MQFIIFPITWLQFSPHEGRFSQTLCGHRVLTRTNLLVIPVRVNAYSSVDMSYRRVKKDIMQHIRVNTKLLVQPCSGQMAMTGGIQIF